MRTAFVPLLGALLLAACGNPAATENVTADAPANEAMPGMVGNDMAMTGNDSAATIAPIAYDCKPAMALSVVYDNEAGPDGQARVTLDGREYVLDNVQAGSGARYETQSGRTPGATLVWWNKGTDGMLLEGSTSDPAAEEATLANCSQRG